VYTPQKDFADLTGLNSLPQATLDVKAERASQAAKETVRVTLKNTSSSVAFMVHPRLIKGKDGDDLVPIFWDDNYFSLLPGEQKTINATFDTEDLAGQPPVLHVEGYNLAATASSIP
jgi:exo-1,4-beta-D-glucosaminidase